MTDVERSTPVPRSRWWYVAALVPPVHVLAAVAFLSVFTVALGIVELPLDASSLLVYSVVAVVALPATVLTVLLPVALYRDIEAVDAAGTAEWKPDRDQYAIAAAGGIFVPGVSVIVSAYYLYQRHARVGVP